MNLVTALIESGQRTKRRVILQADSLVVVEGIGKARAGLECPERLIVVHSTLERGIQRQRCRAEFPADDWSDLIRPPMFRVTWAGECDLLREPKVEWQIPASWRDRGEARAISDVLDSSPRSRVA